MIATIGLMMALSFVASLVGLGFLIWAVSTKQFHVTQADAESILSEADKKAQVPNDPGLFAPTSDRSEVAPDVRALLLTMLAAGTFWLLFGSLYGVVSSLKLHMPDWLDQSAALTFGRARTVHLNAVAYGWLSTTGVAIALYLVPKVMHTHLRAVKLAWVGAVLWTVGVAIGLYAISVGWTDGMEWLEIPWQVDLILAAGGACFAIPLVLTVIHREIDHIYVSGWYYLAALVWFPILFTVANIPDLYTGAQQATVNWWFAHNVLGLWLTPMGVAAAYYLIPKIIGKPIFSYRVSLLGFWGLALFYSQVGMHHLIGGPVPTWVVTLSVVQSVMMFVPVIAVAVNQHIIVAQNLWAFRQSLALRFVSTGAVMYTLASFQGSMESVRAINTVTHFTHYTIGHAHMGAYAFVSLVLFGAAYYMVPALTGRRWPVPALLSVHYWLVLVGFLIYFVSLTIGGFQQGMTMLNGARDFLESMQLTIPYLEWRSVGGTLMTLGHFVFALNLVLIALAPQRGFDQAAVAGAAPAE